MIVTTGSIDYSKAIVDQYNADNFNNFVEAGHDKNALNKVSNQYGTQYEEDISANSLNDVWLTPVAGAKTGDWRGYKAKAISLADLKQLVYEGVQKFLFDDQENNWFHALSISGLTNDKLASDHHQALGVAVGQDGWIHFNFGTTTTLGKEATKLTANQGSTNPYQDQLNKVNQAVTAAQTAVNNAQKTVEQTQAALTSAQTQVASTTKAVKDAQAKVDSFKGSQDQKTQALKDAQAKLQTAQAALKKAQVAAKAPVEANEKAQAALKQAQADLTVAQAKLTSLKQHVSDLVNAPANLQVAQAELAKAQAAYQADLAALPALQKAADEATANLAKAKAVYEVALAAYQQAQAKASAATKASASVKAAAEVASAKVKAGMNATASQAQATTLPQTGNAATDSMTVLGLALAGMLFGGIGLKKQRN